MSWRQLLYHARRLLRNALAHRFPSAYSRIIDWRAVRLPSISLAQASALRGEGLAARVCQFYQLEYEASVDRTREGEIELFGVSVDYGSLAAIDWNQTVPQESDFHLWRQKLAHMGFLSPLLVSGDPSSTRLARDTVDAFAANSSFARKDCFSSYWFPYSASHRVLALTSAAVARRGTVPDDSEDLLRMAEFIRRNVAFVLLNVEHELRNNHVERNLAAICFYFTLAGPPSGRLRRRLDREVGRVLRELVLGDGFMAERSAMYQGYTVMALDIFASSDWLSSSVRASADTLLARAREAWRIMSHPDGEIALFNDAWIGEVPQPHQVLGGSATCGSHWLREAGYVRMQRATHFAIFDIGEIGPDWNPGHGHADFLALEVDVAEKRFLVDPGTSQYSTGARRSFERSAAGHNGPAVAGDEPVEYFGCFRVGRMRSPHNVRVRLGPSEDKASASLELPSGCIVTRTVAITGERIEVLDSWKGLREQGTVTLTVPVEWIAELMDSRTMLFKQGVARARLTVTQGSILDLGRGDWTDRYLDSREASLVSLAPQVDERGRAALCWSIAGWLEP